MKASRLKIETLALPVLSLLSLGICATAWAGNTYAVYHNARFGYSIAYPANRLYPQGEADNQDGQVFLSKTADARLRVYGTNFDATDPNNYPPLEDAYREASRGGIPMEGQVKVVTYKKLLKNQCFVVSGYLGKTVFYQKTCYDNQQTYTLDLAYPENQRKIYDPITQYVANSLQTKIIK